MRSGSTRVSQFLSGIGKMATRVFSGNKRRPRSMPGYLGFLRGQRANAVQARLNFIWDGCRQANRIAAERRAKRFNPLPA